MNAMAPQIRCINDLKGVDRLATEWQNLFRRTGNDNPFLSWEWNRAWMAEFAHDHPALIAVVEQEDRTAAIIPLSGRARYFRSQLDTLLADYGELLIDAASPDSAAQILNALVVERRLRRWRIGPLRSDAIQHGLIEAQLSTGRWVRHELGPNPRVKIEGGFDTYMASRPKKLRQEIRTTVNHLKKSGEWSFSEATAGAQALRIYDALVGLHRIRQTAKPGASIFASERHRRFLRDIIGNLEPGVRTHLSALEWKGRIISAAYSLQCGSTLFYWTPSFDPTLRSLSLGKVHIAELIRRCHEDSLSCFDFMGGNEAYKLQWANQLASCHEYCLFTNVADRLRAQAAWRARDWLRERKSGSPLLQSLWQRWTQHGLSG